ncbi:MAG: DNA polymerase III [Parcubacteria group bacterium CG11_big_fil_rev_8_21_14_0_20_39_14]|nr:MAG: DNA polymerase III [Parcubacteria group bacterium CG11_big_fil_rev_8_21_14_0_20_39_14]PIS34993.1 MAG: DNA polymerase III [Parcubacteria group bacterium CG08_land_8_20_14_0_20_38_56]
MKNQEIAQIFYEIAAYLAMEEVPFKPQAYERAALSLETLPEDVEKIYKDGGKPAIEKIPGVGKSIAEKIIEYLKTGKIKEHRDFKKKMPVNVEELTAIEGVGPKMVRNLWKYLKIKDIKALEAAALAGKIRKLPNFREKTEKNILQGIEFLKRGQGRFLLGDILPQVREIVEGLKTMKEIDKISPAGSVRRMKETIGDIDILITLKNKTNADKIMNYFTSLPGIVKVWGKGSTKSSIRIRQGFDVDLRVVPKESFGSALQYFTGSKEHNIATRKIAMNKGLKLNEYGVFRKKKKIFTQTEEKVYKTLGFEYIEPELRENQGEIEAAIQGRLPKIVGYDDIRGDLHCHSEWDGGENPIPEIAKAAQEMGYEYIGISDHTKFLRIEHGLNEGQLSQQRKEINKLNFQFFRTEAGSRCDGTIFNFQILQGCEANILADGSIDIKDDALAKLDYVIAGIHSQMKMPKEKMTERIIRAMKNPNVDIIAHPTGRILQKRDEYQIDFDKILKVAKETKTILEINANPQRLDLNDKNIRRAKESGVKIAINTDAHHIDHLRFMEFGIAQARRGWAEKRDIINAQPLEKLLKFFKK